MCSKSIPNSPTESIPYGYCQCGCGEKTRLAPRNKREKGWIKGEPLRFVHNHVHGSKRSVVDRIMERVEKSGRNGCWIWTGPVTSKGYGCIQVSGKTRAVHRIMAGATASDQVVCHTCDTPRCVNPQHLFIGTSADNVHDMHAKGRGATGERHGNSKLTRADVIEIHSMHASGMVQKEIAETFDIWQATVSAILNGKLWREVYQSLYGDDVPGQRQIRKASTSGYPVAGAFEAWQELTGKDGGK